MRWQWRAVLPQALRIFNPIPGERRFASDADWPAAVLYAAWIGLLLWHLGRRWAPLGASPHRAVAAADPLPFAIWLGLLGWFLQSFAEFSLYIPALAWPAFLLAGSQLGEAETKR